MISNYLNSSVVSSAYVAGEGLINIQNMEGYWMLSSIPSNDNYAWYVYYYGNANVNFVYDADVGVRPVISISKSNIS